MTPWTEPHQVYLSITNSQSLLKLMSIELVMPSNHLILCRPLFPPSIFTSSGAFPKRQFFSSGGESIGVSESTSVLPMNTQNLFPLELTGWLFVVQETLNSLLQHHSSKTSVLWFSVFFMVQLSYPYMVSGKTIAFTRWTFISKVKSLLFIYLFIYFLLFFLKSLLLVYSLGWS